MKQLSYIRVFLYGMAFLLSACHEATTQNKPYALTTVRVDSSDVHIGRISPRTSNSAQYKIHNTGNTTLHITDILPSCECTQATYDKQDTPPGEHVTVTLTYEAEDFSGSFFRTAEVECNAESPVILTLTGIIVNE